MIQIYNLADLRKAVASKPFGWTFEMGDFYPGRRITDRGLPDSNRTRKRRFREWMDCRRFYTASDTLSWQGGSVWTWSDSAGSPTYNMTLDAGLASGALRQGVKSTTTVVAPPNGGTNSVPPDFFAVQMTVTFTSAPAAGGEVQVYLGFSPSGTAGTSNPGGLSGTDAAGTNTDALPQMTFCGSLIASNNIGTTAQYQAPFAVVNNDPTHSPYICAQVYNNASVAFKNTANTSTLSLIPYWRQRAA